MLKTFFYNKGNSVKGLSNLQSLLRPLSLILFCGFLNTSIFAFPFHNDSLLNDEPDKKAILNGRIWWNKYSKAIGNQFFLDAPFLKGSVVFNGKHYLGLDLRYDIANDELLLSSENHPVISMNKEMVDSFTLVFRNRSYNFFNAGNDTSSMLKGYVNLLYNGPSSIYVKYSKKIYPLAVDGRLDLFAEEHRIFINTIDGMVIIKSKKQLFNLMKIKKKEIFRFIRSNKLKCNLNNPESIIPVVSHYDNLISIKE